MTVTSKQSQERRRSIASYFRNYQHKRCGQPVGDRFIDIIRENEETIIVDIACSRCLHKIGQAIVGFNNKGSKR